jgi:ribonucleotide reductase beta subunit family protein with ferritin-like domain
MSEAAHEVHLHDPQTLYRNWEESQWTPWNIDLSADREQWETMDDRSLASFVLGSLMVAEERITTKFSGLVGADGSEEEVTFLATQQVDEARHMQFYARFQDEVVSEPAFIAAHVKRAREQRHIGYGIWFLRQSVSENAGMGEVVRETLRDLLAAVAESLTPPTGADTSILGASTDDLRAFALDGLTHRLNIIGVPLDSL